MPLILEDGTGVAGANTYITVGVLRTYATDRGVAFPAAGQGIDPAIAIFTPHLILACDYLESKRDRWAGRILVPAQPLSWPRQDIYINGWCQGNTMLPPIPTQLMNAQAQLVLEQLRGVALQPTQPGQGVGNIPNGPTGAVLPTPGGFIVRDKVDVLETEWSQVVGANLSPILPAVEAWLSPLYFAGSGGWFKGVRV